MSDALIFATLFATFAVLTALRRRTVAARAVRTAAGGAQHGAAADLLDHLRLGHDRDGRRPGDGRASWLIVTALLDVAFVGVELYEFRT